MKDGKLELDDLRMVHPQQDVFNYWMVSATEPLKTLLASPNLFNPVATRLQAGDLVTLVRFIDNVTSAARFIGDVPGGHRRRLAERVDVIIIESQAAKRLVDWQQFGPIKFMPESPDFHDTGDDIALSIEKIAHDYRLESHEGDEIASYAVSDGERRTVESFKTRKAAEDFLSYQLAAFPDYVVKDDEDAVISPRFTTKAEAQQWLTQERERRMSARVKAA